MQTTVNHGCCCIKYLATCRLLCLYMYIPFIYQRPYQSVHTLSSDHLITRATLSHYYLTVAFIIKQSHVDLRFIARFNHLYHIIVVLDRVNFIRSFFLCYFLAKIDHDKKWYRNVYNNLKSKRKFYNRSRANTDL